MNPHLPRTRASGLTRVRACSDTNTHFTHMFRSAYEYADFYYNIICALLFASTDFTGNRDLLATDHWLIRRRWAGNAHTRTEARRDLDYARRLASHTGR